MRSKLAHLALFVLVLLLCACGDDAGGKHDILATVSGAVGLADEQLPPGEVVDIVVDASEGSPASAATAEQTIDAGLAYAAERPGSLVRVWALGMELADTRLLATVQSTAAKKRGERARKAEAQRFLSASKPVLMQAIAPIFERPAKKQSPIAEGISRVAYSRAPAGMLRHIIVITDARQVGGPLKYDLECGRIPNTKEFVERLHANAILTPQSLTGTSVHFAYVALEAVPKRRGCPVTLARAQQIEAAWRAALQEAGARAVSFTTEGPFLDPAPQVGGVS